MLHFFNKKEKERKKRPSLPETETARLTHGKREPGSAAAASKRREGLRCDKLSSWLCNWRFFPLKYSQIEEEPQWSQGHCSLWPYFSWFH